MLRIAICCGEGFASGFLAKRMNKESAEEELDDDVSFVFIPFIQLYDRQDEVDIAMLMPHVETAAKDDPREYRIPLYVIPYKFAAETDPNVYYEDAEDILKLANGKGGLITFPDEPMHELVSRNVSHRSLAENQK